MKNRVPEFLLSNHLFYVSMIAPIQRGSAEIIHADSEGVLLREIKSGAYMLTVTNPEKGRELLHLVEQGKLFLLHQQFMIEEVMSKYALSYVHTCVQAAYFHSDKLPLRKELIIRQLQTEHFKDIWERYHTLVDADYIQRRLCDGALYGGFIDDEVLCSFIGEHEEGSIGLLEVFPEYRGKGYGATLTSYMVNHMLGKGLTPFSQVTPDNDISLRLHRKLGFTISEESLYWLFNEG